MLWTVRKVWARLPQRVGVLTMCGTWNWRSTGHIFLLNETLGTYREEPCSSTSGRTSLMRGMRSDEPLTMALQVADFCWQEALPRGMAEALTAEPGGFCPRVCVLWDCTNGVLRIRR